MKKLLLFALVNCVVVNAFSASLGARWRWRNNDGNEKTATWKAAQMQPVTISNDNSIRFRAQFYAWDPLKTVLRYGSSPETATIVINDNPNTTNAFYLLKTATTVSHREATTQQLIQNGGELYYPESINSTTFTPGIMITKPDAVVVNPAGDGGFTEFEWVLKPTQYAQPGAHYAFSTNEEVTNWRLSGSESPWLSIHNDYGAISLDSITRFTIKKNGADIDMTWNTALQGHDHFEIEGRPDTSGIFKHLATVAGGNVTSYKTTLKHPPTGQFQYRIKLFDKNLVMSTSKAVKFNNESADVLLKFSLHPSGNTVLVKWTTALNKHDHFIIQKSVDNVTFNDIATIPGGTGQQFSTTLPLTDVLPIRVRMKLYDEFNRETITPIKKLVLETYAELVKFEGVYEKTTGWVRLDFTSINEFFNNSASGAHSFSILKDSPTAPSVRVAKIPGLGWSKNTLVNYTFYDKDPDPNFKTYRIQYMQYNNPKYMVTTITLPASSSALTFAIYPNPANSGKISFDLKGYKGKTLTAALTNLYGKSISKETFSVSANENYVLKTNISSGTYVLNVTGEGVTKTGKVLVQ